jgi:hypothetical protein
MLLSHLKFTLNEITPGQPPHVTKDLINPIERHIVVVEK